MTVIKFVFSSNSLPKVGKPHKVSLITERLGRTQFFLRDLNIFELLYYYKNDGSVAFQCGKGNSKL